MFKHREDHLKAFFSGRHSPTICEVEKLSLIRETKGYETIKEQNVLFHIEKPSGERPQQEN